MKIALDFDETITLDPIFWGQVIELAKRRMHTVTIVTYRPETGYNTDIQDFAAEHGLEVVYTSGVQKSNKFKADVWIDDQPITIPGQIALYEMLRGCMRNGG